MAAANPLQGRRYHVLVNGLQVSLVSGNILDADTQVVVTGDDPDLTGAGGVSQALIRAGGPAYQAKRNALITGRKRLQCGRVYPTEPGQTGFHQVFHAISMRPSSLDRGWQDLMCGLYREMVQETVNCGCDSVATPLLGTGHANVPCEVAARNAIKGLMEAQPPTGQPVRVVLYVNDPVAKAAAMKELQQLPSLRPLPVSLPSKSGGLKSGCTGPARSSSLINRLSPKQTVSTPSPPKDNRGSPGTVSLSHSTGIPPPANSSSSNGTRPPTRSVARSVSVNEERKKAKNKNPSGGPGQGRPGTARKASRKPSPAKISSPPRAHPHPHSGTLTQSSSLRDSAGSSFDRASHSPSLSEGVPASSPGTSSGVSRRKSARSSGGGRSSVTGGTEAGPGTGAEESLSNNRGQRLTRYAARKSADSSNAKTATKTSAKTAAKTSAMTSAMTSASHGGARPKIRPPAPLSSDDLEEDGDNLLCSGIENGEEEEVIDVEEEDGDEASVEDPECAICRDDIADPKVLKCGHRFCTECIQQAFVYKPVCPSCGAIHGVITGTQPPGHMEVSVIPSSLPGFHGCGTFTIDYNIPSGIQGPEHPNPGSPFCGTFRRGFLPQCQEGELIVRMLRVAFKRRMVFTVGRSTTTGRDNVVTWNDIHHKTSMDGGPQRFGYPDPTYLQRVKEELESKGVQAEDAVGIAVL